jgi:CheY-like chemotaxis protein
MNLNIGNVNLHELLKECLGICQPSAAGCDINLHLREDGACEHQVLADPFRLKQILIKLLSHTMKYKQQGSSVVLQCRREAQQLLCVEVIDTGKDEHTDELRQLTEPTARPAVISAPLEDGEIDLPMVRQLVEEMRGKVGVSREPAVGTTVWFTLPLTQIQSTQDVSAQVDKRYTVVYVEDNQANLRFMQKVLNNRKDINLLCAENAMDGIELITRERPALVLMDIQMPEMDGYQAFNRLQEQDTTKNIPVVAVSANAMEADIQQARALGFCAYLTKPLDIHLLYSKIDEILRRR